MAEQSVEPVAARASAAAVARQLFGAPGEVFAVLDGAASGRIVEAIGRFDPLSVCLYRGQRSPVILAAAPWLVQLERGAPFTEWLLEEGWGRAWAIFAQSRSGMLAMRVHFRRLLLTSLPDGRQVFFRYYDPRVLRAHLPTCTPGELATLFGAVDTYVVEAEAPGHALRLARADGALSAVSVPLGG